jgi:hypothetical protein
VEKDYAGVHRQEGRIFFRVEARPLEVDTEALVGHAGRGKITSTSAGRVDLVA